MIRSDLFAVYAIIISSRSIFFTSLVLLKVIFNKATAYACVVAGIIGVVSVAAPFFITAPDLLDVIASVLTTTWFFFEDYRLL